MKNKQEEANWFWKLTTKWWFFLVLYLFMSFLSLIVITIYGVYDKSDPLKIVGMFVVTLLFLMPLGFVYLLEIPLNLGLFLGLISIFIYHALIIGSIIAVPYFKHKENRILKWLIIFLFLVIVISFFGVIIGHLTNFKYSQNGFV
ncbi:hypothetical protein HYX06_00580 [Candidatus Woesearchaeota archaeon]|nr:hypothetical protein [Candidatus Woesearchaeota archaeon]